MRSMFSSRFRWVAIGVAFLVLAIGISALLDPLKRGQDPGDPVGLQGLISSAYSDTTDSDSVSADFVEVPGTSASYGGTSDVATFQDRADLVVRDASGKVKHRETIR